MDFEFTPTDVENMNFAPSLSRHTFFTHKVVCVRFVTDREVEGTNNPGSPSEDALEGNIDGSITINHDTLKWRRNGEKIVVIPFKKDEERVIHVWFFSLLRFYIFPGEKVQACVFRLWST